MCINVILLEQAEGAVEKNYLEEMDVHGAEIDISSKTDSRRHFVRQEV